jgi:hypothetical protein
VKRLPSHRRFIGCLLAAATALAGCATLDPDGSMSARYAPKTSMVHGIDRAVLQTKLLSLAEFSIATIDYATRSVVEAEPPPSAVVAEAAVTIRLNVASIMTALATTGEPETGLLDMLFYASLRKDATETWLATRPPDAPEQALGIACRRIADEARELAASLLTEEQLTRIESFVDVWRAEHPNATYVGLVRLEDLDDLRSQAFRGTDPRSLEPSMLAPVTQAEQTLERTRIFGERLAFVLQRMPYFARWQAEDLAMQLLERPELTMMDSRLEETQAALRLLAASIDAARAEAETLRGAFAEVQGADLAELRTFAGDVRATVGDVRALFPEAKETMADLKNAIEGAERVTSALQALTKGPDGKPLDLSAIAAASDRFATASHDLRDAIAQANTLLSSEDATRRLEDIAKTGRASIDHLIWRIGQLIIIVGSLAMVLRIVWVITRPRAAAPQARRNASAG